MKQKKISVIIPTYNRADIINKCIESVIKQTYSNLEIIVVDDGSSDNTEEVVRLIDDRRVIYYRYNDNKGACFARNYGVQRANGEYIAFQDSDDFWNLQKLEFEYEYLIQGNYDLVFCGINRREHNDEKSFYYPIKGFCEKNALDQLLVENRIGTPTILAKKELVINVLFDTKLKRFQDWDFAIRVAVEGYKIGYLNKALVDSYVRTDSISYIGKRNDAYVRILDKHLSLYNENLKAKSMLYMYQAREYRYGDYSEALKYLKMSIKTKWSYKTLVKLVLSYFRLWK